MIIRDGGRITGLTTAATIWLAAALGMGIGGAHYLFAGVAAGILSMVLWIFPRFEGWFHGDRETRSYRAVCPKDFEKFEQLDAFFHQCRLQVKSHEQIIQDDQMICTWEAFGSSWEHAQLTEKLHNRADVKELRLQY